MIVKYTLNKEGKGYKNTQPRERSCYVMIGPHWLPASGKDKETLKIKAM